MPEDDAQRLAQEVRRLQLEAARLRKERNEWRAIAEEARADMIHIHDALHDVRGGDDDLTT